MDIGSIQIETEIDASQGSSPENGRFSTPGRAERSTRETQEREMTMQLETTPQDLLATAALQTMDQIRLDQEKAPPRLKPMLAYIESHLFDPKLNVNRLKEACGIRDNSVAIHFHAAVGKPPHAYISHCRLETAARLLRDTDLPVWKISDLLGFSSIQVFSRAFCRWSGKRPTAYRREVSQERRQSNGRPSATHEPVVRLQSEEYWKRAISGRLRDDEAAALIQKLLEIYPPGRRQQTA